MQDLSVEVAFEACVRVLAQAAAAREPSEVMPA